MAGPGVRRSSRRAWHVAACVVAASLVAWAAPSAAVTTLDETLGGRGYVTFEFPVEPGYGIQAASIRADANGRILVAGALGREQFVARLLPDGRLDTSFGAGGYRRFQVQYGNYAVVLRVDGDGIVVHLKSCCNPGGEILRLTNAGADDPTFSPVSPGQYNEVVASPSRVFVADGASTPGTLQVRAFDSAGHADTSWGDQGLARLPLPADRYLAPLNVDNEGRLLVVTVRERDPNDITTFQSHLQRATRDGGGWDATLPDTLVDGEVSSVNAAADGRIVVGTVPWDWRYDDAAAKQGVVVYGPDGRTERAITLEHNYFDGPRAAFIDREDGLVVVTPGSSVNRFPAVGSMRSSDRPDVRFGAYGTLDLHGAVLSDATVDAFGRVLTFGLSYESRGDSSATVFSVNRFSPVPPHPHGYWLLDSGGHVYAFGDAGWQGNAQSWFSGPTSTLLRRRRSTAIRSYEPTAPSRAGRTTGSCRGSRGTGLPRDTTP